MGRYNFLTGLLVTLLLASCFSHGYGRKMTDIMDSTSQVESNSGQVIEVMDYPDPEANTNPNAGYIIGPPPLP